MSHKLLWYDLLTWQLKYEWNPSNFGGTSAAATINITKWVSLISLWNGPSVWENTHVHYGFHYEYIPYNIDGFSLHR